MEYTNQQMTILKTIVQAILVMFLVFAAVIVANSQRSLYQDFKAHNAGDIITVLLVENVAGSSTLNASSQSNVNGTATGTPDRQLPALRTHFRRQFRYGPKLRGTREFKPKPVAARYRQCSDCPDRS